MANERGDTARAASTIDGNGLLPLTIEEEAALLSAIFARSPDGMLYLSPDDVIRAVNERAAKQAGLHRGRLLGRPLAEVLPAWMDKLAAILGDVRQTGNPFQAEAYPLALEERTGRGPAYWDISVSALYGTENVFLGYLLLYRDATERQRAEEDQRRLPDQLQEMNQKLAIASMRARDQATEARRRTGELDATINSIADGVLIYSSDGKLIRMNPAAETLLGYPAAEGEAPPAERMAMLSIETVEGEPFPAEMLPFRRALHGDTVQGAMMIVHTPDGRSIWVLSSAGPIRNPEGELLGAVVTFADITALEDRQERREGLIRRIAHDLRNPLTTISVQAELLQRRMSQQGQGREAEIAEAILANARRMDSLIADLVEVGRADAASLDWRKEPTDLARLITDVTGRMGTLEDRARVRVEAQKGVPPVLANPEHIERAIVHLVTNALASSPPETPVVVRLEESDGEALVSISNQGPGIPPEDIPHLFERFFVSRGGARAHDLSLGLYITGLIVEAHSGSIWAQSQVGKGTTIYFTLPFA